MWCVSVFRADNDSPGNWLRTTSQDEKKTLGKSESLARLKSRGLPGSQPSCWCSVNKKNMPSGAVMRSLISQGIWRVCLASSQRPSICQGANKWPQQLLPIMACGVRLCDRPQVDWRSRQQTNFMKSFRKVSFFLMPFFLFNSSIKLIVPVFSVLLVTLSHQMSHSISPLPLHYSSNTAVRIIRLLTLASKPKLSLLRLGSISYPLRWLSVWCTSYHCLH